MVPARRERLWELYREPEHTLLCWQFAPFDAAPFLPDLASWLYRGGQLQWYVDRVPHGSQFSIDTGKFGVRRGEEN